MLLDQEALATPAPDCAASREFLNKPESPAAFATPEQPLQPGSLGTQTTARRTPSHFAELIEFTAKSRPESTTLPG
jgi:hypothetical protein